MTLFSVEETVSGGPQAPGCGVWPVALVLAWPDVAVAAFVGSTCLDDAADLASDPWALPVAFVPAAAIDWSVVASVVSAASTMHSGPRRPWVWPVAFVSSIVVDNERCEKCGAKKAREEVA